MQRSQTNVYNNQGWLAGVSADARFDAGGGASLSQQLAVSYQFDASGNRVQISNAPAGGAAAETGSYSYDAAGRMLSGRDDKRNEVVNSLSYDGFGNRLSETRTGETTASTTPFTSYTYDANNRVLSSSAGEARHYDANGYTTSQTSRDGSTSTTAFNAENRSTSSSGGGTTSSSTYDAAGNVTSSRNGHRVRSFIIIKRS